MAKDKKTERVIPGFLPYWQIVVWTGILMLVWGFGSYIINVLTSSCVPHCFPPFSGCVPISNAGSSGVISSIFYRGMVLPLASFIGISLYFIIQYLDAKGYISSSVMKGILFFTGVIFTAGSLIVTQALLNGQGSASRLISRLHVLFAFFAFMGLIIYEFIVSLILVRGEKSGFNTFLFVLSLLSIFIVVAGATFLSSIHHMGNIVEWNLFIVLMVWLILMGVKLKPAE